MFINKLLRISLLFRLPHGCLAGWNNPPLRSIWAGLLYLQVAGRLSWRLTWAPKWTRKQSYTRSCQQFPDSPKRTDFRRALAETQRTPCMRSSNQILGTETPETKTSCRQRAWRNRDVYTCLDGVAARPGSQRWACQRNSRTQTRYSTIWCGWVEHQNLSRIVPVTRWEDCFGLLYRKGHPKTFDFLHSLLSVVLGFTTPQRGESG